MILNLHFDSFKNNQFNSDGLYITIERNSQYQIGAHQIHIELASNQITKDNDLWALCSNLVDRSPANPFQAISYFTFNKGKINQSATPSPVVFYPLETHQLENAQFIIRRITKEKQINIEHAFIQLEITKA